MRAFDFLPREPLYRLPPDFLDGLMDEFRRVERRRKRRRASAILAVGFCLIAATYTTFQLYRPAVHYEIPVATQILHREPTVNMVPFRPAYQPTQMQVVRQRFVLRN